MDDLTRFAITIDSHVAHVKFTRTDKANALDVPAWFELKKVFRELDARGDIRCAVLSSEGKHFCAGIDLAMFMDEKLSLQKLERGRGGEKFRHFVTQLQDCISVVELVRFPVIAAIQGGCMGAGLDLITACDIRLATNDAWFQITETQIGMTADVGTLQRIQSLIPSGIARELAYTARKYGASEGLAHGLINQSYNSHQTLLAAADTMAKQIASNSPMSVSGCKHILNYSRDHGVEDALRYQTIWQAAHFHQDDMIETMGAKFEQRSPKFADLPPKTRIIPEY